MTATNRYRMRIDLKCNEAGLAIIRQYENFEEYSYLCIKAKKLIEAGQKGFYSIGYGHTGPEVGPNQRISREMGENLLHHDLERCYAAIHNNALTELSRNAYSALSSWIYNLGGESFRASEMLKKINQADMIGASIELTKWHHIVVRGIKIDLKGLQARREAERLLFLKEDSKI